MSDKFEDFDDLDGGLGDEFDFDDGVEQPKDDRSPVNKALSDGAEGFKESFKSPNLDEELQRAVEKIAPQLVGHEAVDSVVRIKDDFVSTLDDAGRDIKRNMRPIATALKRVAPKDGIIGDAVNKFSSLFDDEYAGSGKLSEDQMLENKTTAATTGSIIYDIEKAKTLEERINNQIQFDQLQDQTKLLQVIGQNSDDTLKFHYQYTLDYYKRTLKLQYNQVFLTKDIKGILAAGFDRLSKELDAVTRNTALPDVVKIRSTEALKARIRNKVNDSIAESLFSRSAWVDNLTTNMKAKITNLKRDFVDGLTGFGDIANEVAEGVEQANEMTAEGIGGGPGEMGGQLAADFTKNTLAAKFGKVLGNTTIGKKLFSSTQGIMADVPGYLEEAYSADPSSIKGKLSGWLLNQMRSKDRTLSDIGEDDLNDSVVFDKRTQTSIVKVIPGLLSKILNEIQHLQGKDTDELIYNYNEDKFVERKEFADIFKGDIKTASYRKGLGAQIKSLVTKVENANKDIKLTPELERKLMQALIRYVSSNTVISYKNFEKYGFYNNFTAEEADTIRTMMDNYFNAGDKNEKLKDFNSSLSSMKASIIDPKTKVLDYKDNGRTQELVNMGILKYNKERQDYELDYKAYYKMLEEIIPDITTKEFEKAAARNVNTQEDESMPSFLDVAKAAKEEYEKLDKDELIKDAKGKATDFTKKSKEKLSELKDKSVTKIKEVDEFLGTATKQDFIDAGLKTKEEAKTFLKKQYGERLTEEQRQRIESGIDKVYTGIDKVKDTEIYQKVKEKTKEGIDKTLDGVNYVKENDKETILKDLQQKKEEKAKKINNLVKQIKNISYVDLKDAGLKTKEEAMEYIADKYKDIDSKTLKRIEGVLEKTYKKAKDKTTKDFVNFKGMTFTEEVGSQKPSAVVNKTNESVISASIQKLNDTIIDLGEKIKPKEKSKFDNDGDGDRDGNWRDRLKFWNSKDTVDKNGNVKKVKLESKSGGIFDSILSILGWGFKGIHGLLGTIFKSGKGVLTVLGGISSLLGGLGSFLGFKNAGSILNTIFKTAKWAVGGLFGNIWSNFKGAAEVVKKAAVVTAKTTVAVGGASAALAAAEGGIIESVAGEAAGGLAGTVGEKVIFDKAKGKAESVLTKAEKALSKIFIGKSLIKKIPVLGLVAGLGFGIQRMLEGDMKGGLGELLSGVLSLFPGLGTLGSFGVDAWLANRDDNKTDETTNVTNVSKALKDYVEFTDVKGLPNVYVETIREYDLEIAKYKLKISKTASDSRKEIYQNKINKLKTAIQKIVSEANKDIKEFSKEQSVPENVKEIARDNKILNRYSEDIVNLEKKLKDPTITDESKNEILEELAKRKAQRSQVLEIIKSKMSEQKKDFGGTVKNVSVQINDIDREISLLKRRLETETSESKRRSIEAKIKRLEAKKVALRKKEQDIVSKVHKAAATQEQLATKSRDAKKDKLVHLAREKADLLKGMEGKDDATKAVMQQRVDEIDKEIKTLSTGIVKDAKVIDKAQKLQKKKDTLVIPEKLTNDNAADGKVLKGLAKVAGFIIRKLESRNRYNTAGVVKGENFVSFGAYQFTEKNGNLKRLLKKMLSMGPSYKKQLENIISNMNSKGYYQGSRTELVTFLKQIGNDTVSKKAQDTLFYKDYYQKAEGLAKKKGITEPIVILHLVDQAVNGGFGSVKSIIKALVPPYTLSKVVEARLARYRSLKGWNKFGKGWTNRVNEVTKLGQKYLKGVSDGGLEGDLLEESENKQKQNGESGSEPHESGMIGMVKDAIRDILEFFGVDTSKMFDKTMKQDGLVRGNETSPTKDDMNNLKTDDKLDDGSPELTTNNASIKNPIIVDWKTDLRYQSLGEEAKLFFSKFSHYCAQEGIAISIPWMGGNRTQNNQKELYAKGRTKPGKKITWTLKSYHIGGRAIDIISSKGFKDVKTNARIAQLMRAFAKANPELGAQFLNIKKDPNHIQFPNAKKIKSFDVEAKIAGTTPTDDMDIKTQEKYGAAIAEEPVINEKSEGTPLSNVVKKTGKGIQTVGDGAVLHVPKDTRLKNVGASQQKAQTQPIEKPNSTRIISVGGDVNAKLETLTKRSVSKAKEISAEIKRVTKAAKKKTVVYADKPITEVYSKDRLDKLNSIDDTLKKSLVIHKATLEAVQELTKKQVIKHEPIHNRSVRNDKVIVEREPLVNLDRKVVK